MKLPICQIDAFADGLFQGNPAAVCPLEEWPPDATLQAISEENNLSEAAFFVGDKDHCDLRWFTPTREVDLCGHATLAAARVLFETVTPSACPSSLSVVRVKRLSPSFSYNPGLDVIHVRRSLVGIPSSI